MRLSEHGRQKVISGFHLLLELSCRVDGRIDLSADRPLSRIETVHDLSELDVANDNEIDVAARLQLPTRGRAVNEGDQDPGSERGECLSQLRRETGGLGEERLELGKDGRGLVRLVVDLATSDGSTNDPGLRQHPKVSGNGSLRRPGHLYELSDVIRLVRMRK